MGLCRPSVGLNAPSLTVARGRSFTAWKTEDLDVFSASLLHLGAPKTWCSCPSMTTAINH